MNIKNLFFGLSLILTSTLSFHSNSAMAATDPCVLMKIPIQKPERFSNEEIDSYQSNLKRECSLVQKYQDLQATAHSVYSIDLTDISVYQALRYVERYRYEDAANQSIPVNKIYQRYKTDYSKPNDQKSSEIWDNFTTGIKQLEVVKDEMSQGKPFDVARLQQVHKGFYNFSDETGDFGRDPHPGVLKPAIANPNPWWTLKDSEVDADREIIEKQNANYQAYGLIPTSQKAKVLYDTYILSLQQDSSGTTIHSGDERVNRQHVQNLLTQVTALLNDSNNGLHMVLGGRLITSGQLAYLAQQYYVGIHPFYDGNGRTSRFIQELILTSSGLPHGSSGDLMASDVLTANDDYYTLAINKNFSELDEVASCLDTYKDLRLRKKSLRSVSSDSLPYKCQLID